MRDKIFKLFWVILLVVSSFILGYYLKPNSGSSRTQMINGMRGQFNGRPAPPLDFRSRQRR